MCIVTKHLHKIISILAINLKTFYKCFPKEQDSGESGEAGVS